MKPVYAVIGAGYGDEGKGLMTDFLARKFTIDQQHPPLVVRGNGGAQAGHTVVTADGRRFVFGHHGSGTFAGSDTFLASNFIVNPLVFRQQSERLRAAFGAGRMPSVTASPACRVTTIYDMAINSIMECSRGGGRHGSCGMGINETVTRHAAGFQVRMSDLAWGAGWLAALLEPIHREWVPRRVEGLVPTPETQVYFDVLANDDYLALARDMIASAAKGRGERIETGEGYGLCALEQEVVYEGAQGLAIDEFLGEFPHVTRSVTGLPSAVRAAHECGRTEVQPVYVTRCYATRHGAGPLPGEGVRFCDREVRDLTNVDNQWQGSLRYAPLDIKQLYRLINLDVRRGKTVGEAFGVTVLTPKLAVTCLDQVGEHVVVRASGGLLAEADTAGRGRGGSLTKHLRLESLMKLDIEVAYESWGPTADDIIELEPWKFKETK